MPRKSEYEDVTPGEWVPIPWRGLKLACCDCGLVHTISFRKKDPGSLQFKVYRDNRATAGVRRGRKRKR